MKPPRVGLRLLLRGVDEDLREWVTADVEHRFLRIRRRRGAVSAHRWFWNQVALALMSRRDTPRPFFVPTPHRSTPMIATEGLSALARDLRYAWRDLLFKNPTLTAVAVMTLALGIGANTAIFSVLHAVMLRPLPFAQADELAMIWRDAGRGETTWISAPEFLDYREELAPLLDVAAFDDRVVNLTGTGAPLRLQAASVSSNYFDVLGVRPSVGRGFSAQEEGPQMAPAVVISDGLWRRRFGADPGVVGRDVLVDGTPRTVLGVLPPALRLPIDYREETRTELYVPFPFDRSNLPQRGTRGWHAVARRAPGVSIEQARGALGALHERWIAEGLFGTGDYTPPGLMGLHAFVFGEVRPLLLVLAGAAGFVLAIACANVASLLLARGEGRRREIGVRMALGAGRWRLARQMMVESMVLAFIGGAAALLITAAAVAWVRRWGPAHVPRLAEVGIDGALLLIALGVTMVTGLMFGILPALHAAGTEPKDLLSEGASRSGRRREAVRRTLVVGELALAVMLAVAAVLMVRSFAHVRSADLGFDPANVLTLRIELPSASYADGPARLAFWTQAIDRIESLPGVAVAGAARRLPLASNMGDWSITIEGRERVPGENPNGDFQVVMPGYFEAMGMELLRGRTLAASDHADALPVVVISEAMAETYWPGEEAIGKRFRIGDETTPWYEIVGIVAGMKHNTVLEEPRTEMYHTAAQFALAAGVPGGMSLVIRSSEGDPRALVQPVRRQIDALDAALPVADVRTLREVVGNASADTRFAAGLLTAFGCIALLLAATGIYGVVGYSVRRQTRDIGIRMAIGADRSRVFAGVARDSGASLLIGLGLGIAGALALGGSIGGLLVGVDARDPVTYLLVVGTVVVVTLLAAAVPARRATTVDPVVALRDG